MFLNKVKNNNFIFAVVLISLILFSSTNTWASLFINTEYEVGINSKNLYIGDRDFYINDEDPIKGEIGADGTTFGGLKYEKLHGNPLYPNLLKIPSYISILFGQSTTSKLWKRNSRSPTCRTSSPLTAPEPPTSRIERTRPTKDSSSSRR